ncbi:MAG: cobalt transporter CbiM [Candidatus Metalachnospira sp.]|nr:cobalt transporter CbiM [Candidatus Metalachnospira sp.]
MHIPENYLSPSTCAVMGAVMIPVWTRCVKKVKETIPKEKMPMLGVGAALSFLGMMLNIPLPGGTTGHAVGGTLIALVLGPHAACLSVTVALVIQALLFGDGGILAIGANCFNMAFVLPFVGYYVYQLLLKSFKGEKGKYIAAGLGSYIGINAAALCAAVEFGIQPLLFTDAGGNALYCPYPLSVAIPAMMAGHLTIFGLAEIIFTVAVFAYISKVSPNMAEKNSGKVSFKPFLIFIAALICITPIGLLAEGTAWGEWGADEIAAIVSGGTSLGYTPSGMTGGFEWSAIFPDYTMGNMPEWFGYILCGLVGAAITVILFKVIAASMKEKTDYSLR